MNLLRYVVKKFNVPINHTVFRRTTKDIYVLIKISFTDTQLIATYGDEDFNFDIVIRGQS